MRKRVPYRENPGCARKKHLESPASGSTPPRGHRIRARPIFIPGRKIAAFKLNAVYKDDAKIYTEQNVQAEKTKQAAARIRAASGFCRGKTEKPGRKGQKGMAHKYFYIDTY